MKSFEGGNAVFSNGFRCEKREVGAEMLKSISVIRTCRLTSGRARKTTIFALLTVKSFAVLSVRERSSGNSAPTMPHNRRKTSTETRILPMLARRRAIGHLVGELIHLFGTGRKRQTTYLRM